MPSRRFANDPTRLQNGTRIAKISFVFRLPQQVFFFLNTTTSSLILQRVSRLFLHTIVVLYIFPRLNFPLTHRLAAVHRSIPVAHSRNFSHQTSWHVANPSRCLGFNNIGDPVARFDAEKFHESESLLSIFMTCTSQHSQRFAISA